MDTTAGIFRGTDEQSPLAELTSSIPTVSKSNEVANQIKKDGYQLIKEASEEDKYLLGTLLNLFAIQGKISQDPFDPFLEQTEKKVEALNPLLTTEKEIEDAFLCKQTEELIRKIKNVEESYISWQTDIESTRDKWDTQINTTPDREQLVSLLTPLTEQSKEITTQIKNKYKEIRNELVSIAKERIEIEKKINLRIAEDKLDKLFRYTQISKYSAQSIVNKYDHISLDSFEANILDYHKRTENFISLKLNLKNSITQMNTKEAAFFWSFNYLCYLIDNLCCSSFGIQAQFQAGYTIKGENNYIHAQ